MTMSKELRRRHAADLILETSTHNTHAQNEKSMGEHKSCKHNKQRLPQTISLPSGHGIGSVLTRDITQAI